MVSYVVVDGGGVTSHTVKEWRGLDGIEVYWWWSGSVAVVVIVVVVVVVM